MELCKDLFSTPKKLTKSKMFGHYLRAITAHSPTQHELASLRSLNTENQERLFGQARSIAESCTNHHPENVIPQVMLRLQAKQEQHVAMLSVERGDSQVSHIAKNMPPLPGMSVKQSFLKQRQDSWQLHLQKISPFLTAGEGVWWTRTSGGFHFHDGDEDSATQNGDHFTLLHFRHHSIVDVEMRQKECWNRIIQSKIIIPATEVKVYDTDGKSTGRIQYSNQSAIFVPITATISTSEPQEDIQYPEWSSEQPDEKDSGVSGQPEIAIATPEGQPSTLCDLPGEPSTLADLPQLQGNTTNPQDPTPPLELSFSTGPQINYSLEKHDEGLKTSLANSIKKLLPN